MAETVVDSQSTAVASPNTSTGGCGGFSLMGRPKLRVTSEYDSESSVFLHKVSSKILDNLAKLKLSFNNDSKGEVSNPQVSLTSKCFSLHYDVDESDVMLKTSFEVVPGFRFGATHQVKARQGEVSMAADVAGPVYKFELSSAVPSVSLVRLCWPGNLNSFVI